MNEVSKDASKGRSIGPVSVWLLLLLSEKPMYGYGLIKELDKKFAGYWKPKTGTIYPALDRLENSNFVVVERQFRDTGPDRKLYTITEKGKQELSNTMSYFTKMSELVENYKEVHESIYRFKRQEIDKKDLSEILINFGEKINGNQEFQIQEILPTYSLNDNNNGNTKDKKVKIKPTNPITFKFLFAKEDGKLEVHMEIEWPA